MCALFHHPLFSSGEKRQRELQLGCGCAGDDARLRGNNRGIHRTEVENFFVGLLRSLLSIQVTGNIDRVIDDVQHRQYKGEYKV